MTEARIHALKAREAFADPACQSPWSSQSKVGWLPAAAVAGLPPHLVLCCGSAMSHRCIDGEAKCAGPDMMMELLRGEALVECMNQEKRAPRKIICFRNLFARFRHLLRNQLTERPWCKH